MTAKGWVAGQIMMCSVELMVWYSYMILSGKYGSSSVIIITIYRVYKQIGVKMGPDTTYMQQYAVLRERRVWTLDSCKQILDDLTNLIDE